MLSMIVSLLNINTKFLEAIRVRKVDIRILERVATLIVPWESDNDSQVYLSAMHRQ